MKAFRVLIVLVIVLLLGVGTAFAQNRYSLNGYIKDSLSGESIIGATLTVNGQARGVTSNQYGFFSITLPEGNYVITASHISYFSKPVT
ncbi:MAG TPA: carboxypeptidase-like regulatory domain-containing protein, partial [Chitinophagaceae bacterium]|nr:carboxypeptidase-like regulatory domain-containing protein [Chitinophagaceae bacterium]